MRLSLPSFKVLCIKELILSFPSLNKVLAGVLTLVILVGCGHLDNPLRDDGDTIVSTSPKPVSVVAVVQEHWRTLAYGCNEVQDARGECEYYSIKLSNGWVVTGLTRWVYEQCDIGHIYPACNSIPVVVTDPIPPQIN